MTTTKHNVMVRLDEISYRQLVAYADREDRSLNYVMNRAIREFMDRQPTITTVKEES